jgi:K+-transporting ATPase ATPase C chain
MGSHLRANLWLLVLTVVICSVLYPLVLYGVGQTVFRDQASGSLVRAKGPDGNEVVVGSRLIASPFGIDAEKGKPYFHPRPSAAGYNATASGGSNWGGSNPKLRDRIARQLGPIIKYNQKGPKRNDSVQKDIETWFANHKPGLVAAWAGENGTLAVNWVKSSDANKAAVIDWLRKHPAIIQEWRKSKPDADEPDLDDPTTVPFDDIAVAFFESFAAAHPNRWPEVEAYEKGKRFKAVQEGNDLQATFFDAWLGAHPQADLEKVPADMVTASGSGLDPHITLDNALSVYQLDRVALARGAKRSDIEALVKERSFRPLSGLVGKPLVNVLELNLELDEKFPVKK